MHVDCTFANLGGDGQGCENCTAAISAGNTTVTVVNSTFFAPAPFPVSTYIRAWNGGRVLLSGCLFGPGPELSRSLFFTVNAVIYSDSKEAIAIRSLNNSAPLSQSSPVSAIPAIPPDSNDAFLQRDNPWFVDLLEVRLHCRHTRRLTCSCPVNFTFVLNIVCLSSYSKSGGRLAEH